MRRQVITGEMRTWASLVMRLRLRTFIVVALFCRHTYPGGVISVGSSYLLNVSCIYTHILVKQIMKILIIRLAM